jgi:hypothetical protein
MTVSEMYTAFRLHLDKSTSLVGNPDFLPEEFEFWINQSLERFIKQRMYGNNYTKESFEQTQKRINDLRTLVTEINISTSTSIIKPNSYSATLPNDYLFTIGEEVDIQFIKNSILTTIRQAVKQITSDNYRQEIDNPMSEFILNYYQAMPLRLYQGSIILLISDGNYTIPTYYLRYIKTPNKLVLGTPGINETNTCELPTETHSEIVIEAVKLVIENTENPRVQTFEQLNASGVE